MPGIKAQKAKWLIDDVVQAIRKWSEFAQDAGVSEKHLFKVQAALRLKEMGLD